MIAVKFFAITVLLIIPFSYALANDVNVAYNNISKSLDPYEQLTHETLRTSTMVFDSLVRSSKAGGFDPSLAVKWKVIDESATRFYLNKNVYFHSGKKLNVDDIIFTYQRMRSSPDFKSVFEPIKNIKAVDDYTFDIISKRSFPLILNLASVFFPMDSEFYSGKTADGKNKSLVTSGSKSFAALNTSGTGAFIVKEFSEDEIIFIKNKSYWKKSNSDVESITIKKIEDEDARVDALLSGRADVINPIGISGVQRIRESSGFEIVNLPGSSLVTFLINFERSPGLKDRNIRLAMNHAIDKELIIEKTMKDLATPAEQFSPPIYAGHNMSLRSRYDPKRSLELIKEADFKGPLVFDMIAPDYRDEKISKMIVDMLKAVGIQINLKMLSSDDYWDLVDASGADLMLIGWFSDTKDSNNFFEHLAACRFKNPVSVKFNSGKYCNPDVDQLIKEANVIMKPTTRAEVLKAIEQKLYSDAMHLPLFWENVVWAAKPGIKLEDSITGLDVPYYEELIINDN